MYKKASFNDKAKYCMFRKAAKELARWLKFELFKTPVSLEALKGATTTYGRKYESFVSNLAFEETRPAKSKAAAETRRNDGKGIESRLKNRRDALSEQFQNVSLILQKKESQTQ